MMKNPIIQNIKKSLIKNAKIKDIVASAKHLEDIINKIEPFKSLCGPTKQRLRQNIKL